VNRKVWIASVISTVVALMLASMAVAFAAQEEGGNAQEKVTICHKGHTITVAAPALAAHERHGDTEGACPAEDGAGEGGADEGQEGMASSPAEGRDLYGDSAANTLRGTLHADFLQSGRGSDVVLEA
jgi:hypothetical protein